MIPWIVAGQILNLKALEHAWGHSGKVRHIYSECHTFSVQPSYYQHFLSLLRYLHMCIYAPPDPSSLQVSIHLWHDSSYFLRDSRDTR